MRYKDLVISPTGLAYPSEADAKSLKYKSRGDNGQCVVFDNKLFCYTGDGLKAGKDPYDPADDVRSHPEDCLKYREAVRSRVCAGALYV